MHARSRFARRRYVAVLGALAGALLAGRLAADSQKTPPADNLPVGDQTARFERALGLKKDLVYDQTPLSEVISQIQEAAQITIRLDNPALTEAGISTDSAVTMSLKGLPLSCALKHLLYQLDLTYVITDEMVLVTTPDKASAKLLIKGYPVADLGHVPAEEGATKGNYKDLMKLLQSVVATQTWDEVGGQGSATIDDGVLMVSQTRDVQEELASVLGALRRVRKAQSGMIALEPDAERAANDLIRRQLLNPTTIEADETPLTEVLATLAERHGIPILISDKALTEAGIATDTPVNEHLKGVSLRAALKHFLSQIDLTATVSGGVLLITTSDHACTNLKTRLYPVGDLVNLGGEVRPLAPAAATPGTASRGSDQPVVVSADSEDKTLRFERLIKMIMTHCAPQAWDEVGGQGSLEAYEPVNSLVCNTTDDVHEQVEIALAELRGRIAEQPLEQVTAAAHSQPIEVKHYRVVDEFQDEKALAELASVVQKMVAPKSWTEGEAVVLPAAKGLLVRQTPSVQRQVVALLRKMKAVSEEEVKPAVKAMGAFGCIMQ